MELLQTYAKEIVALLVPFITWLLNAPQRKRARLIHGTRHTFTFLVQEPLKKPDGTVISPTQTLQTASVILQNTGGQAATGVELVLNWKPIINWWPSRHVEEKVDGDGRYSVLLSSLAPHEFIGFELLAINGQLPQVVTVRCDQCVSTQVAMAPQQLMAPWKTRIFVVLVFLGLSAAAYLVLVALQWVLRSPGVNG